MFFVHGVYDVPVVVEGPEYVVPADVFFQPVEYGEMLVPAVDNEAGVEVRRVTTEVFGR